MKHILPIALLALGLAACDQNKVPTDTGTKPVTPQPAPAPTPQPAAFTHTLTSVTVADRTVTCPGNYADLGVDCSDARARFDGKNYDLGATLSNPARTGTYTLSGTKIALSSGFGGTWTEQGNQARLYINELHGGSFKGAIRLPVTFTYTRN